MRYEPAAANGAAARTAETPPMIFRKSRRDMLGFVAGDAPSNSVASELPQQLRKSVQERQLLENFRPCTSMVLPRVENPRPLWATNFTVSFFSPESFVRVTKTFQFKFFRKSTPRLPRMGIGAGYIYAAKQVFVTLSQDIELRSEWLWVHTQRAVRGGNSNCVACLRQISYLVLV